MTKCTGMGEVDILCCCCNCCWSNVAIASGPDKDPLKPTALAPWTSSQRWSRWLRLDLNKRIALFHYWLFPLDFIESWSLEMGFWSLKCMESMVLSVSCFCFMASSKACFYKLIRKFKLLVFSIWCQWKTKI